MHNHLTYAVYKASLNYALSLTIYLEEEFRLQLRATLLTSFRSFCHLLVNMQQRLIAHVQRAHELQCRDLEREVEWRDNSDGAIRPSDSIAGLAHVVAGIAEPTGKETHLIATKIL